MNNIVYLVRKVLLKPSYKLFATKRRAEYCMRNFRNRTIYKKSGCEMIYTYLRDTSQL